jgi:hypothetical protein
MLTLRYALAIIVIAGQANKFPRPGPARFGFFFDDRHLSAQATPVSE